MKWIREEEFGGYINLEKMQELMVCQNISTDEGKAAAVKACDGGTEAYYLHIVLYTDDKSKQKAVKECMDWMNELVKEVKAE